jgi:hypothetical protein
MTWYLINEERGELYLLPVDRIVNECGAVSGMRIGRGNRCARRKPATVTFVYHKSHMIWDGWIGCYILKRYYV